MQILYVYAQSAETTAEITNTTTCGGCYTDSLETIPGNGDNIGTMQKEVGRVNKEKDSSNGKCSEKQCCTSQNVA